MLLHVALRQVFDSWLNSQSDAKVAIAGVIVVAPLVLAAVAVARAFQLILPKSQREPQYPQKEDSHPEEPPSWH